MNLGLIELRHLRYFLAVAEAAHFTRAAETLHVTQPTLSHQIRQLEGQLNLSLFDRVGRRVKLTAAGELLLPHARRVLRELAQAQAALTELHGLKRGTLKVGVMQTVNTCVIPEIVARFGAAHPGIRLTCGEMSVDDIETGLETGKLDLGVSFLPATRDTLDGERLFTEELVVVVPARHPLTRPTPSRGVGLLWLRGAHRRAAAQAFAKVTAQVLKERRLGDTRPSRQEQRTGKRGTKISKCLR